MTSDWLVFIDADVRVHRDTLLQISESMARNPDAVAIFGAYDDQPRAHGVVSQYRNLLHRYVHLRGAGDAETFWRIPLVLGVASLVALLLWNMPVIRFFARLRGLAFATAAVPLHMIHYITNALSATIGLLLHFASGGRGARVAR